MNEENRVELWWVSTYSPLLTYLLVAERGKSRNIFESVFRYIYDERARVTLANSAEQRKNTCEFHTFLS